MTCLEVEENDAQSDEIVAISTTIEAMINRMDLVDSDLKRWKKVDFIRESFKGSKSSKSSKVLKVLKVLKF